MYKIIKTKSLTEVEDFLNDKHNKIYTADVQVLRSSNNIETIFVATVSYDSSINQTGETIANN